MRVLIENGSHGMRNLGDIAMLQVAVHRLQGLWPHASIDVLTGDDDRLIKLCPNVRPVPERGSRIWSQGLGVYDNTCGPTGKLGKRLNWAWRRLVHHGDLRRFMFSLDQSEVVVASGGGYINDIFEPHAMRVLTILEAAIQSGKLTAMLGQGVGPLESLRLRAKATSVLPRVHLIGVREKHTGPAILESLGVESARVMVTLSVPGSVVSSACQWPAKGTTMVSPLSRTSLPVTYLVPPASPVKRIITRSGGLFFLAGTTASGPRWCSRRRRRRWCRR